MRKIPSFSEKRTVCNAKSTLLVKKYTFSDRKEIFLGERKLGEGGSLEPGWVT